ncbi:hypothetical protein G3A43_07740 [Paraburkholderia aspalathi]|nr:hypothetical protein [Paraburkholderia aspalathi]MBK3780147.1 hypothetical protein [Paraburkholderia aspalathi]
MADTFDDDFPRIPNRIIDNDKAFDEMVDTNENTPLVKHQDDHEILLRNQAAMDAAAVGEGPDAVVLSHTPAEFDRIVSDPAPGQPAQDANKAHEQATGQDPAAAPAVVPTEANQADPAKGAGAATGDVTRPSGVDEALGAIRQRDNSHERRFVIVGDPDIKRRFMDTLAASGKLKYQNGAPVIGLNRKAAIKLLQEVASKVEGASAEHALHLTAKREGMGLGAVTAALKNTLGGRHTVDVMVVGSAEVRAEKMKELADTLGRMRDDKQFTERVDGKNLPIKDGAVVLPTVSAKEAVQTRPVVLESSVTLNELLARSKDNVEAWKREVLRQKDERNGPKEGRSDGAKDATGKDAGKEQVEKPNTLATKTASQLSEAFANPASLSAKNDNRQVTAASLMKTATLLNDPYVKEVGTLPTETRQQLLVQLSALATKLDAKEFGEPASKVMDTPHKATDKVPQDARTAREKLSSWLSQEASADPQFVEKAKVMTASLVQQGILTEKQAAHVNEQIAKAGASKEAGSAQAGTPANAPTNAPTNAPASAQAEGSRAPDATAKSKDAAAAQDAKAAPGTTTATSESTKESAPSTVPAQDGGKIVAHTTDSHTSGTPVTAEPGTGAATSREAAGDTFSARLAAAFKDGPAAVTVEQARGIIAELETRREQPLSTLAAGEGLAPVPGASRTLTQVKNVLLNASMGQFGEELAAKADTLHSAVREWSRQESDRIATVKLEVAASHTAESSSEVTPVTPLKATDAATSVSDSARTADTREASDRASGQASAQVDATAQSRDAAPNAGVRVARMQAGSGADAEQQSPRSSGQPSATAQKGEHAGAETKGGSASSHGSEHGRVAGAHPGAASEQTRVHAETLYKLMGNPAGSFTRRDKSWNLTNIGKAAQAIAGLDPRETAKLASAERSTLAAYSVWLADAANSGKIPGFTSESGRQLAAQVTEKATGLIQQVDGALPASTQKEMAKAERMVDAKLEHDLKLSKTADLFADLPAAGRGESNTTNTNAKALALDLVHAVYRQSEMNEGYANYLLKSAGQLSPESLRGLDPDTKARTIAALNYLAGEVRNGAMGDFDQLSGGVQRNVLAAQAVADKLHDSVSKEPGMTTTLTKAYLELNTRSEVTPEKTHSSSGNQSHADTLAVPAGTTAGKSESDLSGRADSRTSSEAGRTRSGAGGQEMDR